jgi:hypothetical protein
MASFVSGDFAVRPNKPARQVSATTLTTAPTPNARSIDWMSGQRFVGRDLEYVEHVLGRQHGVVRWPTLRCISSPAPTEGNRRWQRR